MYIFQIGYLDFMVLVLVVNQVMKIAFIYTLYAIEYAIEFHIPLTTEMM